MLDDAALLRRYLDEQAEDAFAELVRRHIDLVYSAALRQVGGDAHRAHDVAQLVFTTLARKARSLANHPALAGWLYNTTQHMARRAMRSEYRRLQREREAFLMSEHEPESSGEVAWQRIQPLLDEAMRDLGARDREAVVLRFFARQPFVEIGAALQLSEDAARMRVERALEKLHARLAARGITSTTAALSVVLVNEAAVAAPAELAGSVTGAALVAANGSAISLAAVIHFMSTTKFAAVAAVVFALLGLGTAGQRLHAQREMAASVAGLRTEQAALTARWRETSQRAIAAEQKVAELKQAAAAGDKNSPAAESVKPAARWDPVAEGKTIMRGHPEVAVALREASETFVNMRFSGLFKARGLTPEQIAEFTFLWRGVYRPSFDLGGQKERTFAADDAVSPADAAPRIKALLGAEGHQSYIEWNRAQGARWTGRDVAEALAFTETPLTVTQLNRLVEVVSAATPKISPPPLAWDAIKDVDETAREILTATQLPAWSNVVRLTRANRDVSIAQKALRDLAPKK